MVDYNNFIPMCMWKVKWREKGPKAEGGNGICFHVSASFGRGKQVLLKALIPPSNPLNNAPTIFHKQTLFPGPNAMTTCSPLPLKCENVDSIQMKVHQKSKTLKPAMTNWSNRLAWFNYPCRWNQRPIPSTIIMKRWSRNIMMLIVDVIYVAQLLTDRTSSTNRFQNIK